MGLGQHQERSHGVPCRAVPCRGGSGLALGWLFRELEGDSGPGLSAKALRGALWPELLLPPSIN